MLVSLLAVLMQNKTGRQQVMVAHMTLVLAIQMVAHGAIL